jgi:hypothetical protein
MLRRCYVGGQKRPDPLAPSARSGHRPYGLPVNAPTGGPMRLRLVPRPAFVSWACDPEDSLSQRRNGAAIVATRSVPRRTPAKRLRRFELQCHDIPSIPFTRGLPRGRRRLRISWGRTVTHRFDAPLSLGCIPKVGTSGGGIIRRRVAEIDAAAGGCCSCTWSASGSLDRLCRTAADGPRRPAGGRSTHGARCPSSDDRAPDRWAPSSLRGRRDPGSCRHRRPLVPGLVSISTARFAKSSGALSNPMEETK